MKNNNGKIAIAIVAMLVVALSVVGFTYAYFTAQVVGNANDESVEVTAGKLEINYTLNKTISATNIVPNWASDGDKYYDPIESVEKVGNENRITAVSYAEFKGKGIPAGTVTKPETLGSTVMETLTEEQKNLLKGYGITEPAMFTVQNTGTDTAYYAIDLTGIVNGIVANNAADKEYVKVDLYSSTTELAYDAEGWGAPTTVTLEEGTEAKPGKQTIVQTASVSAETNKTIYYKLVLRYDDSDVKQNVAPEGETYSSQAVKVSVTVRGLGQNNQTTTAPAAQN